MSETRFTPGPWVARRDPDEDEGFGWFVTGDGYVRAHFLGPISHTEANARLCAAAPTLYDTAAETVPALRRLIAEMNLGPDGEGRDWLDMLTACADDLDAAMAKARGEA